MKKFVLAIIACAMIMSCATGPTPEQLAAQTAARAEAQRHAEEAAAQERAREEAERAAVAAKVAKAEAIEKEGDEAAQSGEFLKALDRYKTALSDTLPSDVSSRLRDKAAKAVSDDKMAKVRAAERAGDEAAQSGVPQEALSHYAASLNAADRQSDLEQQLREKIVKYASTLTQLPEVPENARRHAIRAQTIFKTGRLDDFLQAASEMQQALLIAPWWSDGYYNLALMQEGSHQYGDAITSLKLCLLATPQSADAKTIQGKIYELEVKKEDTDKTLRLVGVWRGKLEGLKYVLSIDGDKIEIRRDNGKWVFRGAMKGLSTFEGIFDSPAGGKMTDDRGNETPCEYPFETGTFTGKINDDRTVITLKFTQNSYSAKWQGTECMGVTVDGRVDKSLELVRP